LFESLFFLGKVALEEKDFKKSRSYFGKCLDIDKTNFDAKTQFGVAHDKYLGNLHVRNTFTVTDSYFAPLIKNIPVVIKSLGQSGKG
jgi:hypothetical protein